MSVRFRVFASGQLNPGVPQGYKVPPGKSAVVNSMRFTRGTAASIPQPGTLDVLGVVLLSKGSLAVVFPDQPGQPFAAGPMIVEERDLPLSAGDELMAIYTSSTAAGAIDFILCGIERDA